jgi:hypothetical protein
MTVGSSVNRYARNCLLLLGACALLLGTVPSAAEAVTVNAGTRLMIKTETPLNTGKTKEGERFVGFLEGKLVVGGVTVAPEGAKVYGKVVAVKKAKRGRAKKKQAKLVIQLTDILVDGKQLPIVSDDLTFDTERPETLKKVAKSAAIGGLIDGKDGAKQSAAIRTGIELVKKGSQIDIEAGSLLEFRLMQPLVVK